MGAQGLAAFGVIGYINLILLSVFLGMGQGTQPLVSRFHGQGDYEKINYVYRFSVMTSAIFGALCYGLILLIQKPVTAVFIDPNDVALTQLALSAIPLFFFSFPITGINVTTASIFEAKHCVGYSIAISFLRAIGFLLPVLVIMNTMANEMLLWAAVPVAEILVLPVAITLWKRDGKGYRAKQEKGQVKTEKPVLERP